MTNYKFKDNIIFKNLREKFNTPTMYDVLGVARKELQHTNFLGWLMDKKGSHKLADKFLKDFIIFCILKEENKKIEREDLKIIDEHLFIDKPFYKIAESIGETKLLKDKKNNERPDIFIRLNININENNEMLDVLIENKIYASESKDQTNLYDQRYEEYFKKNKFKKVLKVFLSPNDEANSSNFISITYQDIYSILLKNKNNCKEIEEYLKCLYQPREIFNSRYNFDRTSILAIDENWMNNSIEFVKEVLEDNDLFDSIKTYKDNLNQNDTIYSISDEEIIKDIRTLQGIIYLANGHYKLDENNLTEKFDELNNLVNPKMQNKWAYNGQKLCMTTIVAIIVADMIINKKSLDKLFKYQAYDNIPLVVEDPKEDYEYYNKLDFNKLAQYMKKKKEPNIRKNYYVRNYIPSDYLEKFKEYFKEEIGNNELKKLN